MIASNISRNGISKNKNTMKTKWLILLAVIVCSVRLVSPVLADAEEVPTAYDLIDAVNAYRSANGLPILYIDPLLMLSAQMHAEYLASQGNWVSGHVGAGGTDADARAAAVGYPQVPGLDINENWAMVPVTYDLNSLIRGLWGDPAHTHTMLHWQGQHVGAGVALKGDQQVVYVLNVAAFWGDGGLTQQPTSGAYPGLARGDTAMSLSQYMAPVQIEDPDERGWVIHHVLPGQTLWTIATTYGVKIDDILRLNALSSDSMIYVGQELLIKIIPTATVVPSVTMGNIQTVTMVQDQIATHIPTEKNTVEKSYTGASVGDQTVMVGILVIAVLGFGLVILGQRRT